jgi:hypothetical protein
MAIIIRSLLFKDMRRLRTLLILWGVVLLVNALLYAAGATFLAASFEYQSALPLLLRAVDFLEQLLVAVMIPMCLHEEPVVGSTAFWFSRPLARRSVLATKGLFLAVFFLGIPLLLEMSLLALNHVPAWFVFLAAPEIIQWRLPFILWFVFLASVTSRFSEIIKVMAILGGIGVLWMVCSQVITMVFPDAGRFLINNAKEMMAGGKSMLDSMMTVSHILPAIVVTGLIIHQHLTRYTARTVRWAVVLTIVTMAVTQVWRIDFLKPAVTAESKAGVAVRDISVSFDPAHMSISSGIGNAPTKVIRSRCVLSGYPAPYYALATPRSTMQMRYSDGTRLDSMAVMFRPVMAPFPDEALMPALEQALGGIKVRNPWKDKFADNDIFELTHQDFEKFKGRPGVYAVDMRIDLFRYEITSTVPLKRGAVEARERRQIRVFDLKSTKNGLSVTVMERHVNMLFDRSVEKRSIFNLMSGRNMADIVVLVNRRTGEAFLPVIGDDAAAVGTGMNDLVNEGLRLQFLARHYDYDLQDAADALTPAWLQDAELVRLSPRLMATVNKAVRIGDFALPAVSTDPDPERHTTGMASLTENWRGGSWKDLTEEELSAYPIPSRIKDPQAVKDYKYKYLAKQDHKAFSFSDDGPYGYCYGRVSADEARECASDYCDRYRRPGQASCQVISVDGNIVTEFQ